MKSKRIYKLLVAVFLAATCVFGMATPVLASPSPAPEDVFPEEEVTDLWDSALQQDVVPDKGSVNDLRMTVNSTESTNSINSTTSGVYPTRKGEILVTTDPYMGSVPSGHAAIVYNREQVVESLQDGVQFGKNRWDDKYTVTIGLTVNSTTLAQDAAAAEWCAGQRGKPYNYNFFDVETRDRFYCSQLVWASFHDLYGIDLNTWVFGQAIHPAELVLSDQTRTVYTHTR